jgi:acetyl-CoA acetyltransferase
MREVAVAGVGLVPFTRRAEHAPARSGAVAVAYALTDAGIEWSDVGFVAVGAMGCGMAAAPALLEHFPRTGVAAVAVENASATGSAALDAAHLAVAAGRCDVAVAAGFGSLEDELIGAGAPGATLSGAPPLRAVTGADLPAVVFALRKARRMHDYGETSDVAARVAVKNFANAATNPSAQRQRVITLDDVMESPAVVGDLHRLECCPLGHGASAAVLVAADAAPARAVKVLASVNASDQWHPTAGFQPDPHVTARTAAVAFGSAGIRPDEVDVVEVHDAFSVEELDYCEGLGLCDPGDAGAMLADGGFDIGGRVAVSPSGGLLARGHPGGATGLAQVFEIVQQLRGEAGDRQQPDARLGLAQMIGAGGACTVQVYGR